MRKGRQILLVAGLVGLVALFGALPASAAGPTADSPDPHFVPAPGPLRSVPGRIGPGTDRGLHLSGPAAAPVPGPSRKGGSFTARILIRTVVRDRPGGKPIWVARGWAKWSGGFQQLMVLGSRMWKGNQWLKVRLPERPNGADGWLPRDRVALGHSPWYLSLDLSRRRLTVYGAHGRRKSSFEVVVGKPGTPTPTGLFAIYDRVRQSDPRGFIGPWAVPLTAHSVPLRHFDGGPGLVALHGRDGASFLDPLGSARSHGCVRMNNSRIRQIVKLAPGTAIRIRH